MGSRWTVKAKAVKYRRWKVKEKAVKKAVGGQGKGGEQAIEGKTHAVKRR